MMTILRQVTITALSVALWCFLLAGKAWATPPAPARDWLGPDSVVLVCGAAGYLGAEVALGLHRTYAPKQLILVDEFVDITQLEGLSRFEFQRQRLFRVLQNIATSDSTEAVFFRVDLRPEVPELLDSSVVPLLQYIVEQWPDITHIVSLPEDKLFSDKVSGNPRAVLTHALLDAIVHWENTTGIASRPQFTYASSAKVYSGHAAAAAAQGTSNGYKGRDDRPISEAPISLEGSAYLLDEILAQEYYDSFQVDSVGLRMFSTYGPFDNPWSVPAQIFEQAIASLSDSSVPIVLSNAAIRHSQDYVFIDDAVDAVMTAMQLRPSPEYGPLVINVGSGETASPKDFVEAINTNLAGANLEFSQSQPNAPSAPETVVANTQRAKRLLGWEKQMPLPEGILKTLGWHFDRTFPFGKQQIPRSPEANNQTMSWETVASWGRLGCDARDFDCLRGMPVFPCASECSHVEQCFSSFWDRVADTSRQRSSHCSEVWYTISLDPDVAALPSANVQVSSGSTSGIPGCNFAFVSAQSPLANRVRNGARSSDSLQYESWTLILVDKPSLHDKQLVMLPKLSPGRFFSSTVELAVFTEPHIAVDIDSLLSEARVHPNHPKGTGETAMLIGENDGPPGSTRGSVEQSAAYRMIHIKSTDYLELNRDGFGHQIDSSLVMHRLGEEDVRSFRCDVFGEVYAWKSDSDVDALSFVAGLHDMWSQIMVETKGADKNGPWWHDENVEAVSDLVESQRRRLVEESEQTTSDTPDGFRKAPLQYHHLLQNQLGDGSEEEEHIQEVHHFDENGFGVSLQLPTEKGAAIADAQAPKVDTEPEDFETTESTNDKGEPTKVQQHWLGMLSSGDTSLFVRLVSSDQLFVKLDIDSN